MKKQEPSTLQKIKKTTSPNPAMAKNLSLLERAQGFDLDIKTILCLIDKKTYLKEDILAYLKG